MEIHVVLVISAVSMGMVYLIDMAMAGLTYNRASQPMFVSSVTSFLPAPLLLFLGWQMPSSEAALAGFGAGVVLMVANWLYFSVIYSDAGECSEVAAFESSSILVIAAVAGLMHMAGVVLPDSILPRQWIGVGIGAVALMGLSIWGDKMEYVTWSHRIRLIGFMVLGAAYEILTDYSMHLSGIQDETAACVAVSPFFWTGLATGVVAVLPKGEWTAFKEQWTVIRSHWKAIALAELCALVGFGSALYGFAGAHVAVVAMIAGSFPIVVLIGGQVLRRYGGFTEAFPPLVHPWKKSTMIVLVVLGAALASWR